MKRETSVRQERTNTGVIVVAALAILLVVLPSLYVLSIGPAVRLLYYDWISRETYQTVYYPAILMVDRSEVASEMLVWYARLWVPGPN